MIIIYSPIHVKHDPASLHITAPGSEHASHPEIAARGTAIYQSIVEAGIATIADARDFGIAPLEAVHSRDLLALLQTAYQEAQVEVGSAMPVQPFAFPIRRLPQHVPRSIHARLGCYCFDIDTPILEHTWEAAYWSAQVALTATEQVLSGQHQVSYAICRPPGHHASSDMFGGFCYLNNVAIAAQWLAGQGQRVAIIDLDFHHGNGTQDIFYHRSDVLFCSIHADPHVEFPFYSGLADERGNSGGYGATINYPLPPGTGEGKYLQVLAQALEQIVKFAPDTLLVSLGLDILEGDPLGGFTLGTGTLQQIGKELDLLHLPTVIVQEGGYRIEGLGASALAFLREFSNHSSSPSTV